MEAELDGGYHVFVQKRNHNFTEIYPVEQRNYSYEVIMEGSDYEKLNGTYTSLNAIKTRILELFVEEMSKESLIKEVDGVFLRKCPDCHSFFDKDNVHGVNKVGNTVCKYCKYDLRDLDNIWSGLDVFPQIEMIAVCQNRQLSQMSPKGTLKIIKN